MTYQHQYQQSQQGYPPQQQQYQQPHGQSPQQQQQQPQQGYPPQQQYPPPPHHHHQQPQQQDQQGYQQYQYPPHQQQGYPPQQQDQHQHQQYQYPPQQHQTPHDSQQQQYQYPPPPPQQGYPQDQQPHPQQQYPPHQQQPYGQTPQEGYPSQQHQQYPPPQHQQQQQGYQQDQQYPPPQQHQQQQQQHGYPPQQYQYPPQQQQGYPPQHQQQGYPPQQQQQYGGPMMGHPNQPHGHAPFMDEGIITLDRMPRDVEEFIEMRNRYAVTPYGGAAMFILALLIYSNLREEDGYQCLVNMFHVDELKDSRDLRYSYRGYGIKQINENTLKRQFLAKPYLSKSFILGTSPENGYRMPDWQNGEPIRVETWKDRKDEIRGGQLRVYVRGSGSTVGRHMNMVRNDQGIWKVTKWASLQGGVTKPVTAARNDIL